MLSAVTLLLASDSGPSTFNQDLSGRGCEVGEEVCRPAVCVDWLVESEVCVFKEKSFD